MIKATGNFQKHVFVLIRMKSYSGELYRFKAIHLQLYFLNFFEALKKVIVLSILVPLVKEGQVNFKSFKSLTARNFQ